MNDNYYKRDNLLSEDISFMSDVDAALLGRGNKNAYILSFIIALLIITGFTWAHFAIVEEVTRGDGQVIPSQKIQVIQNLEGGILEDIMVHENQIVEKGTVLVRLSNEMAASRFRDAVNKTLQYKIEIIRLKAEAESIEPDFPDEYIEKAPLLVDGQISIFNARKQELELELNVLNSQMLQKQQEILEIKSKIKDLKTRLEIELERKRIAEPLAKKGVYPKVDYLTIERDVSQLEGDIKSMTISLPRVRQAADEASKRFAQRKAEFKFEALNEINKIRSELQAQEELLTAGQDRVTRTEVRSPVRGTIKQIVVNTIGGVIQPGQPIMEIVPLDDTLLVSADIRPADIAFLYPGLKAVVKISAYDFSIYGGLEGVVEQISADTIQDERGDSFYKVKIRTKDNAIAYHGDKLPIIPGMTVQVDIITGQKSVLDYMLKPLLKAKQNALRER
ncbi:MAG: HlyD family type I secretion periplasmic adaptor subunit [Desulfovibrio sp.]